jgi:3-hydroxyacyl-[acyl-carrier-protein] dehydratase
MTLPHLYPILFVDSHQIISDTDIVAKYTVPYDHPVLEGHFPHFPIWPGIHLIEGCSQTAGLHAMYSVSTDIDTKYVTMLASVDKVKFRRPVLPGSKLQYSATLDKKKGSYMFYDCRVYSGTTRVAQAYIGLTATKNGETNSE